MRIIFIWLLLLISSTSYSQSKGYPVLSSEKVFGKSFLDDSEIKGREYVFPQRIYKAYLDTTTGYWTVQMRRLKNERLLSHKGNIVQYDLLNENLVWSKKINYLTTDLKQAANVMLLVSASKSFSIDVHSGDNLWKLKNSLYFIDPSNKIGFGYKFEGASTYGEPEIQGIDLSRGKPIWQRQVVRAYGWNELIYTNDSTMIVVASGLHSINIYTGRGWVYRAKTGKITKSLMPAAKALGHAGGMLTGTYVFAGPHVGLIHDLVSNCLIDSSHVYLASMDDLVKVDVLSGEVIWKTTLPKDLPSKSSIFRGDSLIYMVNYGYAFVRNIHVNFGQPFIAAFDIQTGEQKYLTLLEDKKDPILDYKISPEEFILVFHNRMAKYSKNTGNLIMEKEFSKEDFGGLYYNLDGNLVYVQDENDKMVSLFQTDTMSTFVYTGQREILFIDDELNVVNKSGFEDWSLNNLNTADYKFLIKGHKTMIISNEGEMVAEIEASRNAILIGNTLYDKLDESFYAIDLSNLFVRSELDMILCEAIC